MTNVEGALAPTFTLGEHTATEEQADIINFTLANSTSHLLINALAGAAKTSTLRFLCKYLPPDPTLSVAFNKRIADEMGKLLPGNVRCATMNSVGHRVWAAAIGGKRLTLDTKKNYNLVREAIDQLPKRQQSEAWDIFGDLTKAISKAKLSGYVPSSIQGARSLLTADQFFASLEEKPDAWFCQIINSVLGRGIVQAYGGLIDFDDQIYMPTLFGGSFPQHRRVMVDEAQDLSPLNHAMVDKLVGPGCQLIAVGDPWQSIYAFRGADTRSMGFLSERFRMHEMTLSVSFRCPVAVVRNAHWRVPHMKWPSWAVEGLVETLETWSADAIPDNSAIICRNNAPLLRCALSLLRSGRGVHLVGTDLGPQLVRALKKLGGPAKNPNLDMPQQQVFNAIDLWETEKLARANDSGAITDRAECLRVFAGFGATLGAAVAYCEHLFKAQGPIQLLSGHKAKGLEWDTVYHLDPHRIPSPWSKEGEPLEQERRPLRHRDPGETGSLFREDGSVPGRHRMSQVPEARAILEALELSLDELIESLRTLQGRIRMVIPMLIREPYIRKAPQKNRLTFEAAERIRKYFKEHPNASMQEIASATGVNNMGRVSEVIHGKRFPKPGK